MKRVVSLLGSILMAGGLALLVYVGVQYQRARSAAPAATATPQWSKAERAKAREIASQLNSQTVRIPKLLAKKLPRPGTEAATRLVIPKIGVNAPVIETPPVDGVWDVADWAVGHLTTSPNPGAPGNMALSAHDDIKGEVFKRLDELRPGDQIRLDTPHAQYIYTVVNQETVDPSDVSVLNPTTRPTVTLISCTPYWVDTQRLVVQGVLKSRSAA
jgi:sortase A